MLEIKKGGNNMDEVLINKRVLLRESYGRIGLIDFSGESYPTIITNKNDLERAIKTKAIGPRTKDILDKIFTFTDKVEICVFSKKTDNMEEMEEFLDEIHNNYQMYDFLTILSTAKDEHGVDVLVTWSLKNKRIYLQSVDTTDYYNSDFPYLLFSRWDEDIKAAVSIASHFYNNEKTTLNKDLQVYFFADGSCLSNMVYYRLLQNEIQRNLLSGDNLEQAYLSTVIDKAFDNTIEFMSNHFDDKVEKIGAAIAFNQVHYDYYYNGIYQELTV